LDLNIPAGTSHHESVRLTKEHEEAVRAYREHVDVRKALVRQIVAAVDAPYLRELRNMQTNTITIPIHEIFQHLETNYAVVDAKDVANAEEKIATFSWNIADPPVTFYNMVEDLDTLAEAAKLAKTPRQIVSIGLDVVQKTGDFELGITAWNAMDDDQKTWDNFKSHFSAAYRDLRRVRGPTMRTSSFHQANAMAEQIAINLGTMRDDVMQHITDLAPSPPAITQDQAPPSTPVANASTNKENYEMLKLIRTLQSQVEALTNNTNTTSQEMYNPQGGRGGRGQRNRPGRTGGRGGRGQYQRTDISKYCWTHGACGHDSKHCGHRAPGHKEDSTFDDKMGGSTYYCTPTSSNQIQNQE